MILRRQSHLIISVNDLLFLKPNAALGNCQRTETACYFMLMLFCVDNKVKIITCAYIRQTTTSHYATTNVDVLTSGYSQYCDIK